jgi:hypothetical protein
MIITLGFRNEAFSKKETPASLILLKMGDKKNSLKVHQECK